MEERGGEWGGLDRGEGRHDDVAALANDVAALANDVAALHFLEDNRK
jgi:hypothetical protein